MNRFQLLLVFIGFVLIAFMSVSNLMPFLKTLKNSYLLNNLSYGDKMRQSWGSVYDTAELIKHYIGENGSVMYPPQSIDAWLGNGAITQYFLFPRKLYSENEQLIKEDKIDGVVVTAQWPDFFTPFKKIYFTPFRSYVSLEYIKIQGIHAENNLVEIDSEPRLTRVKPLNSTSIKAHSIDTANNQKLELLDVNIGESGSDIWLIKTSSPLLEDSKILAKVKAGKNRIVALIVEITFSDGSKAYYTSQRNKLDNRFEELSLDNLFKRANQYSEVKGKNGSFYISAVGLDVGVISNNIFTQGVGLIKVASDKKFEAGDLAEDLYFEALDDFKENRLKEADEKLNLALNLTDNNSYLNLLKAQIAKMQKNYPTAREILRKNIEEHNDLWSAIELVTLADKNSWEVDFKFLDSLPDGAWENTYLNLELAKFYERAGSKIMAYKHFIKATKDYPYSAASVEAAHKIADYKKDNSISQAEKLYLEGQFFRSAQSIAEMLADSPQREDLKYVLENAYLAQGLNFDNISELGGIQPVGGIVGNGLKILEGDNPTVARLNLSPLIFPTWERGLKEGTIEFFWQASDVEKYMSKKFKFFLLDQVGSHGKLKPTIRVFLNDQKLKFSIKQIDRIIPGELILSTDEIPWEEGHWYQVTISWGEGKINLFLDKKLAASKTFNGKVGIEKIVYTGLAEDKAGGSIYNPNEFAALGILDDIIYFAYPKFYENGVQIW